jgi:predicted N-formylglutamate amidohydrolase
MVQPILTCEHGGYRVPAEYRNLFVDATETLRSHRGWDPGSLDLAQTFEKWLAAPLISCTVTRLLVELNRSIGHRRLFSEFTSGLDSKQKQTILRQYYFPYRERVEELIGEYIANGAVVVHLSLHTFVPVLNGVTRTADVGLLYDPARPIEKELCRLWQQTIESRRPGLCVRRNYPYLGKSDGLTTHLRRRFSADRYAGIELEVNQRWLNEPSAWRKLVRDLAESLRDPLANR